MGCCIWEAKARAEIQRVNSLKQRNIQTCGALRQPQSWKANRPSGMLSSFAEPPEQTLRPFEVSHGSDLLLMDSVFRADGVLKIRHLTNDNTSDLFRESPVHLTVPASLPG